MGCVYPALGIFFSVYEWINVHKKRGIQLFKWHSAFFCQGSAVSRWPRPVCVSLCPRLSPECVGVYVVLLDLVQEAWLPWPRGRCTWSAAISQTLQMHLNTGSFIIPSFSHICGRKLGFPFASSRYRPSCSDTAHAFIASWQRTFQDLTRLTQTRSCDLHHMAHTTQSETREPGPAAYVDWKMGCFCGPEFPSGSWDYSIC